MKINKLFHWLYAVLMLLPVFAVGTTCLYTIFNENAKDSYYGDTINSVEVKSANNQYSTGNKYTLTIGGLPNLTQSLVRFNVRDVVSNNLPASVVNTDNIRIITQNNITYCFFYNSNTYITDRALNSSVTYSFDFIFLSSNGEDLIEEYKDIITYDYFNKDSFISEAFYYSLEQLKDNDVFNWASTSFLVQPFQYIVNLFGMNTNNVIVLLLSYWLDISIIWLVFDVLMYVPLLIHRWLDKGVIS